MVAEILVLGAGLGGLSTAMLLARGGHQVTVLERDPAEPPPAAQAWEAWERRGINQFRLPHLMLPRLVDARGARQPRWTSVGRTEATCRTPPFRPG